MKVADAMSKTVDFVGVHETVENISRIIFGRGINGVPVVDTNKKIVGFITERDILNQFYPSFEEYMEDPVNESNFEDMEEKVSHIFSLHAGEIMSKDPVIVNQNVQLLRAQSLMFIHKIGRLPVIDSERHLVGMITKGDIFRSLVGDRLSHVEDEEYSDWVSKHYPILMDWENRLSLEIPDLDKIFKKHKVKGVLDVGCGTGEHSIALMKKGYEVWGFERSILMIKEGKKSLSKLPSTLQKNKTFFHGEYEHALKKLKGEFQAAIFMGGSLSFNAENYKRVLEKTANTLPNNSVIVIQLPNFEKILKVRNRIGYAGFQKFNSDHELAFFEFYNNPTERNTKILKTLSISDFNGKAWSFYGLKSLDMAYITQVRLEQILKKLGFEVSFYGSEQGTSQWGKLFTSPFEVSKSDWMNVLATRK